MTHSAAPSNRVKNKGEKMKRILGLGMGIAALVAVGVVFAVFLTPDHDEIPTNVLTADSELIVDVAVSPVTALLTAPAMQPGDVISGQLNLNSGNPVAIFSHISITHSAPTQLTTELVLAIVDGVCGAPGINPDGTASGTNIFLGPYNTAGNLVTKSIPASSGISVCLWVGLPAGVDFSTVQSQTDTSTIVIDSDGTP